MADTLWEGDAPGFDELARLSADAPAGSDGLIFVPHLDGRLLPSRPQMRGAWVGLTRHHTRAHLVRSVLEGVAYEYAEYLRILRELHPEIDLREVRVVGGGARSDTWNAIKASALGVPYARPARGEFSCWGAALVAGRAVGLFDDLAEAAAQSHRDRAALRARPGRSRGAGETGGLLRAPARDARPGGGLMARLVAALVGAGRAGAVHAGNLADYAARRGARRGGRRTPRGAPRSSPAARRPRRSPTSSRRSKASTRW